MRARELKITISREPDGMRPWAQRYEITEWERWHETMGATVRSYRVGEAKNKKSKSASERVQEQASDKSSDPKE